MSEKFDSSEDFIRFTSEMNDVPAEFVNLRTIFDCSSFLKDLDKRFVFDLAKELSERRKISDKDFSVSQNADLQEHIRLLNAIEIVFHCYSFLNNFEQNMLDRLAKELTQRRESFSSEMKVRESIDLMRYTRSLETFFEDRVYGVSELSDVLMDFAEKNDCSFFPKDEHTVYSRSSISQNAIRKVVKAESGEEWPVFFYVSSDKCIYVYIPYKERFVGLSLKDLRAL